MFKKYELKIPFFEGIRFQAKDYDAIQAHFKDRLFSTVGIYGSSLQSEAKYYVLNTVFTGGKEIQDGDYLVLMNGDLKAFRPEEFHRLFKDYEAKKTFVRNEGEYQFTQTNCSICGEIISDGNTPHFCTI